MGAVVKKIADKLTDAEKKKVKQLNKAKANPKQAEKKAEVNLKRRIGRGQEQAAPEVKETAVIAEEDVEHDLKNVKKEKPKLSNEEKALKKQAKLDAIMKEFANAKGVVRPRECEAETHCGAE
jgi:cell division protein YceG involved in septum cleavage